MSTMLAAQGLKKLTVLLTHRCNQRCEFCFDASNILCKSENSDISLRIIDQTIDLLNASFDDVSSFNITLSGGEPTMHPQFIEIVKLFSKSGFPITILSNGQTFADIDFMKNVLKYNIRNLQFSIEGATPDVHDIRVGCKGAWKKIICAIKNAQALGVFFVTNSTLTSKSISEMFSIIDLLDELEVQRMSISSTLPECTGRNYSVFLQYPDIVEIAERLTLYALTKRIPFSFITPLPFCLKESRTISNSSTCSAGRYSVIIDTNGAFRPCSVCNPPDDILPSVNSIGSHRAIYEQLSDVVEKYLRKEVPLECLRCSKFRECRAACPLYWKIPGIDTPSKWIISNNTENSLNASPMVCDTTGEPEPS